MGATFMNQADPVLIAASMEVWLHCVACPIRFHGKTGIAQVDPYPCLSAAMCFRERCKGKSRHGNALCAEALH